VNECRGKLIQQINKSHSTEFIISLVIPNIFEEVSLSTRDIPRILFPLNLHTRQPLRTEQLENMTEQPLRTEQLENMTEKPSNNYMNVSRNFSVILCQVT